MPVRSSRAARALAPILALSTVAAAATLGACAGGTVQQAAAGMLDRTDPATPLPPNPADAASTMFNDARIAATASRSNFSEIEPSRLALERAQMAPVKQYAQMMVSEHVALEDRMRDKLAAKKVMPVDNAFSLQLQRNLPVTLDMLRQRTGLAFDESYMAHMVSSHMTTLHTLDTSLIPEADDAELKAMLQNEVRPKVVAHLEQAKALHRQVILQMGR